MKFIKSCSCVGVYLFCFISPFSIHTVLAQEDPRILALEEQLQQIAKHTANSHKNFFTEIITGHFKNRLSSLTTLVEFLNINTLQNLMSAEKLRRDWHIFTDKLKKEPEETETIALEIFSIREYLSPSLYSSNLLINDWNILKTYWADRCSDTQLQYIRSLMVPLSVYNIIPIVKNPGEDNFAIEFKIQLGHNPNTTFQPPTGSSETENGIIGASEVVGGMVSGFAKTGFNAFVASAAVPGMIIGAVAAVVIINVVKAVQRVIKANRSWELYQRIFEEQSKHAREQALIALKSIPRACKEQLPDIKDTGKESVKISQNLNRGHLQAQKNKKINLTTLAIANMEQEQLLKTTREMIIQKQAQYSSNLVETYVNHFDQFIASLKQGDQKAKYFVTQRIKKIVHSPLLVSNALPLSGKSQVHSMLIDGNILFSGTNLFSSKNSEKPFGHEISYWLSASKIITQKVFGAK